MLWPTRATVFGGRGEARFTRHSQELHWQVQRPRHSWGGVGVPRGPPPQPVSHTDLVRVLVM